MKATLGFFSFTVISSLFVSSALAGRSDSASLEQWLNNQNNEAFSKMLKNISPEGAAKGAVVASPSKNDPDYFYHWIRDAALIMDVVVKRYAKAEKAEKAALFTRLADFAHFTGVNQHTPNPSGPGEPKFNADGSAYTKPWGRPQNDGPALRAITLVRWANLLLAEGKEAYVREKLYSADAKSVIKFDLEFVSHHWKDTCFDLWEEVRGHHFYTRMVQRRALIEGGKLAKRLGDNGAADWYLYQGKLMEKEIDRHWDAGKGFIVSVLDWDDGIGYKYSNLDSSIILGVLHAAGDDGFYSPQDGRVQATAKKLESEFAKIYAINGKKGPEAPAIGRYPEDLYDGHGSGGGRLGNPWFITTHAMAEYYYLLGGRKNRSRGDAFLLRSKFHVNAGNDMSEQINRNSGYMQGAPDLTWSYGSLLTAIDSRGTK